MIWWQISRKKQKFLLTFLHLYFSDWDRLKIRSNAPPSFERQNKSSTSTRRARLHFQIKFFWLEGQEEWFKRFRTIQGRGWKPSKSRHHKKSVSNINIIVKKSDSKLTELQLQELESQILVAKAVLRVVDVILKSKWAHGSNYVAFWQFLSWLLLR